MSLESVGFGREHRDAEGTPSPAMSSSRLPVRPWDTNPSPAHGGGLIAGPLSDVASSEFERRSGSSGAPGQVLVVFKDCLGGPLFVVKI